MYKFHTRRQWETRNFMSRSRAGESRSKPLGNISFGDPVGPENTNGGGGGGGFTPLRLAKYEFLYIRT